MRINEVTFEEAIQLQRERWESGLPILAEELIELCVEAATSDDMKLDIIYGEVIQRERAGKPANESEFVARFPNLSTKISRQFQVHRAMDSVDDDTVYDTVQELETNQQSISMNAAGIPGFEIIELLGRGGSGVAFKARDSKLGRLVAIKLLNGIASLDEKSRSRFLHEAESAASLSHPSIVPIYQIGQTDSEDTFLVMSYLEGGSVFEVLRAGPLSAVDSIELLIPVVDAVHYAHENGIVHRDLKPANILLDKQGQSFVCDFGLAKRIGPEQTLNATETVVGTPAYMPPEQAKHGQSDARSDVYSLGVVLYELLSGRNPFQAASVWETLSNVMTNEAVPLRQLNPSIDKDLETICQRCMEKAPALRYRSAAELLDELKRYKNGEPIKARPIGVLTRTARWAKREPKLASLYGVATLLLFLLGAVVALATMSINDANSNTAAQKGLTNRAKVAAVANALPDALPVAISNLGSGDEAVVSQLQIIATDKNVKPALRLNAALGMAGFGEYLPNLIVSSVSNVPLQPGTCRNIVDGFKRNPAGLISEIKQSFPSSSATDKFRLASIAMFLGHTELAEELCQADEHPDERTRFIKLFKDWNPGPETIQESLVNLEDEDLASAVIIGLGRMDPVGIPEKSYVRLTQSLQDLFSRTESAGVHSAAQWTLTRWEEKLPVLGQSNATGNWRITSSGATMIRFEPAVAVLGFEAETGQNLPHEVSISVPFEIGAKEVTVASFEEFALSFDDQDPLSSWSAVASVSPTKDCPAQRVTWIDAIRYCNWLSRKEGFDTCYSVINADDENSELTRDGWQCDFSASGYRLPTEAEWEYAGRAGSRKATCFGDDPTVILEYVRYSQLTTTAALPVGSLIPNAHGLFDMEGNVWEWCWDQYGPIGTDSLVDPKGPDGSSMRDFEKGRVIRGGGVVNQSGDPYIKARGQFAVERLASNIGFRVVRTLAE